MFNELFSNFLDRASEVFEKLPDPVPQPRDSESRTPQVELTEFDDEIYSNMQAQQSHTIDLNDSHEFDTFYSDDDDVIEFGPRKANYPRDIDWDHKMFRGICRATINKLKICHQFVLEEGRAPMPEDMLKIYHEVESDKDSTEGTYEIFEIGNFVHETILRRSESVTGKVIKMIFGDTLIKDKGPHSFKPETLDKFKVIETFCKINGRIPNKILDGGTDAYKYYSSAKREGVGRPIRTRVEEICATYCWRSNQYKKRW